MHFDITEDQRRTQRAAREFAERVLAPRAAHVDRTATLDADAVAQLRDTGFLGLTIPQALGGSGQDFVTLALVIEELAAGCANTAAFVGTNVVTARALLAHGHDELKSEFLTNVAQGATLSGFVLPHFDPGGSGVPDVTTKSEGVFELRGEAGPMTVFTYTTRTIVFGKTSADGLTSFFLPNQLSQWSTTVLPTPLGKRAAPLAMVHLDGLVAPQMLMLGAVDAGMEVARSLQADARIVAAAEAIGIARAAYEQAVQHVKQTASKVTEPGLLGTQVLLADMCVEIEAARLLTLRAASQADAEVASGAERSMAKLFATEMATRVAHRAMQVLGVHGAVMNPNVERNFRDARMTELSTDGLDLQRANIAQTMLKA